MPIRVIGLEEWITSGHNLMVKRALLTIIILILVASPLLALEVPGLQGHVNDYAGMISPPVRGELEKELQSFEQTDSTQVVILTLPSLERETIEDFSIKVADQWRIGQKIKDNGVILIVAKQERKIRLEVGRGLEGRLTDLLAGRIIDLSLRPNFKRGDFDGGFKAGITSIIDAVRGEFKADERPPGQKKGPLPSFMTFFVILGIAILVFRGPLPNFRGSCRCRGPSHGYAYPDAVWVGWADSLGAPGSCHWPSSSQPLLFGGAFPERGFLAGRRLPLWRRRLERWRMEQR